MAKKKTDPKRFAVSLKCPTPISHPSLTVEAENELAAWKLFCLENGIVDSIHERTIEEVIDD